MAKRRKNAPSEKDIRRRAYEICVQRASSQVRTLNDLLEAELELEKAAGQEASQAKRK